MPHPNSVIKDVVDVEAVAIVPRPLVGRGMPSVAEAG